MCSFGGGSGGGSAPAPIRYAAIKTPASSAAKSNRRDRRRQVAASRTNYTGPMGVMAQPSLALRTALGG